MNQILIYKGTSATVKVGDKVPGKRINKFYAHVTKIGENFVQLIYNGDVKEYRVAFDVIDAHKI